mmetsp:Transcript_3142/g.7281  ORF Transcript_3142/g.7281 Transcript_3142/m.7281 type:complete len:250 (+) Transcript_3142:296-1045(+)
MRDPLEELDRADMLDRKLARDMFRPRVDAAEALAWLIRRCRRRSLSFWTRRAPRKRRMVAWTMMAATGPRSAHLSPTSERPRAKHGCRCFTKLRASPHRSQSSDCRARNAASSCARRAACSAGVRGFFSLLPPAPASASLVESSPSGSRARSGGAFFGVVGSSPGPSHESTVAAEGRDRTTEEPGEGSCFSRGMPRSQASRGREEGGAGTSSLMPDARRMRAVTQLSSRRTLGSVRSAYSARKARRHVP